MKALMMSVCAAAFAVSSLAGCGPRDQVTYQSQPVLFKQGHYQGKPDQQSWAANFNGDEKAWAQAIDKRTLGQNEYVRITRN
ncbi:MAG TPA: hypothetical protein VFK51_04920 [Burkholderiales bacterium]|jgi:hypothetical protein|nr:hypothetical protein [Burkholderiales bacterium]